MESHHRENHRLDVRRIARAVLIGIGAVLTLLVLYSAGGLICYGLPAPERRR